MTKKRKPKTRVLSYDAYLGDVVESPNGNRYVVTEHGLAYIGNVNPKRSDRSEFIQSAGGKFRVVGTIRCFQLDE